MSMQLITTLNLLPLPPQPMSELQSKSGHLKSPQLDITLQHPIPTSIRPTNLAIILKNVTLPDLLHRQAGLDGAPTLPAHGLIDAENDAPPLALSQLSTRDILVIFAALDAVEDQRIRPLDADGREDGVVLIRLVLAASQGVDAHRVVEIGRRAHRLRAQGSHVRHDGPSDVVTAHVGMCVGGFRGTEKRQTHQVAAGGEAVFGVVEDGDAVAGFGEVGEFVAADFEFRHVPAVEHKF